MTQGTREQGIDIVKLHSQGGNHNSVFRSARREREREDEVSD